MSKGPPDQIALDPDDFHAEYVGHTADGRQFFITTHVDPKCAIHGHAFVAVYLFDATGKLLEAKIDDMGELGTLDAAAWGRRVDQRFDELGPTMRRRITMAPFEVHRFGLTFGLIPKNSDGNNWMAEMQPGHDMAFFEPWDSGVYDT